MVKLNVLLDEGSDPTHTKEGIVNRLKLKGQSQELKLEGCMSWRKQF